MSEKVKCPACYKNYNPESKRRCPGCGLAMQDAQNFSSEALKLEGRDLSFTPEFSKYTGLEAQELRDDVNRLSSSVGILAGGMMAMILLNIAGFSLVFAGISGDGVMLLWGQFCSGLGVVIGLISSISAIGRASVS